MERKIYRPAGGRLQREIWRPGDGDGEIGTDYFDRQGAPLPLEQRWRLFQSDIGHIKPGRNEPPKNVVLDDRAAWELLASDMKRAHLGAHWPHDFSISGNLRFSRPHRGRPAVKDTDETGSDRYHTVKVGKDKLYHLTGEKGYIPVMYEIPPKVAPKRKASSPSEPPRNHHNQWTPKDMLVKNGAPSFAKTPKTGRERINRVLRKEPSPPTSEPALKRALYGIMPPSFNPRDKKNPTLPEQVETSSSPEPFINLGSQRLGPERDRGMRTPHKPRGRSDVPSERQKSDRKPYSMSESAAQTDPLQKMKHKLSEEKVARMLKEGEVGDLQSALNKSQVEMEQLRKDLKQSRAESEHYKNLLQRK